MKPATPVAARATPRASQNTGVQGGLVDQLSAPSASPPLCGKTERSCHFHRSLAQLFGSTLWAAALLATLLPSCKPTPHSNPPAVSPSARITFLSPTQRDLHQQRQEPFEKEEAMPAPAPKPAAPQATTPPQPPAPPIPREPSAPSPQVAQAGSKVQEAAPTPLTRYYQKVTGQIEKKWHRHLRLQPQGVTFGMLKILFYVNKAGKVEDLRVLDDKESNPLLTQITLQAIKDAEIPPMPADVIPLLPKESPDRLKVNYDAVIY